MADKAHPPLIKKQQQRLLLLLLVAAALVMGGLYHFLKEAHPVAPPVAKTETLPLANSLSHIDAASLWMERAQHQLAEERKQGEQVKQQVQLLVGAKAKEEALVLSQSQRLAALQLQVAHLQAQLKTGLSGRKPQGVTPHLQRRVLSLAKHRPYVKTPRLNPATFVPAGTFVRAITLGGADASAGITSQANPTPMLFRLLDEGTLPNGQSSHLKGCFATAAAIGDISSERGAVRIERLSCTKPNQAILELPVQATVFGPDGKDGIRGKPVWREAALLERAFAAGTLSGLSSGVTKSYTTSTQNAWGNTTDTIDSHKMVQVGISNGLTRAADKLAEYHIKRAEQYHPVIQLSAGTVVDIVFLKGFDLSEPQEAETVALPAASPEINPEAAALFNADSFKPLPLSVEERGHLQQKQAQGFD